MPYRRVLSLLHTFTHKGHTSSDTLLITYIRESVLGLGLREDEWHESHGGNTEDLHDMFLTFCASRDFEL